MLIPLRTDREPKRRPLVTESLIVLNMLVYLAGLAGQVTGVFDLEAFIRFGHFDPQHFRIWQLFTSLFLHDPYGIWHLAFNMLFLWIFGAAVEDRLTRSGFLAFYLAGGAVACLGHMLVSKTPAIGASGAISAVVGAFLALFPRSRIRVLFFFLIIGVYMIPSVYFILLYFLIDVLNQTAELLGGAEGGVAYMAHITGEVYGFAVAFVLLATRVLKHEEYDVFFLFRQWRRRSAFRSANRQTGGLWDHASADTGRQLARRRRKERGAAPDAALAEARAAIAERAAARDLAGAARLYATMLEDRPDAVFAEDLQLELANQLQADGQPGAAARAYELLLKKYPTCASSADVRLMLALIYARSLDDPGRARALLDEARPALRGAHADIADELLQEIGAAS